MNVLAVLVLNLGINTWGSALFDLDTVPSIFRNSTSSACDPVTAASPLQLHDVIFYHFKSLVYNTSDAIGRTRTTPSSAGGFIMTIGITIEMFNHYHCLSKLTLSYKYLLVIFFLSTSNFGAERKLTICVVVIIILKICSLTAIRNGFLYWLLSCHLILWTMDIPYSQLQASCNIMNSIY